MKFQKGQSGNMKGRPKKANKVMSVLERALPRIENEIHSASAETARELVIGLVDVIKHQSLTK